MVLIPLAAAAAAALALFAYNGARVRDPVALNATMGTIRQATETTGSVVNFIGMLLDALSGIGRFLSGGHQRQRPGLGRPVMSDYSDD